MTICNMTIISKKLSYLNFKIWKKKPIPHPQSDGLNVTRLYWWLPQPVWVTLGPPQSSTKFQSFWQKKLGVPKFFLNFEFLAQKIRKIFWGYVQKKCKSLNIWMITKKKKGRGWIIKKYHKKVQISKYLKITEYGQH